MNFLSHITLQSGRTLKMIRDFAPCPYFSRNQSRSVFLHSIHYFKEDFCKVSKTMDFGCDESVNEKELVAKYVRLYGESSKTWKILSGKLKVKPETAKILYMIHKNQKPEAKGTFSPEENRIIIDYIKTNAKYIGLYGETSKTWKVFSHKLKVKPETAKILYMIHKNQKPEVKGTFSSEETRIIIDYIKTNGYSWKNFKDVTIELSRRNVASVYQRYKKVINNSDIQKNSGKRRCWTYDEDELMLKHIIDDYNDNEMEAFPNVKFRIFEALGRRLNRNAYTCYSNWAMFMQPTLLSHVKGLPLHMNWEWKNHIKNYIIQQKIESLDGLDFNLLKEICPGQTQRSLRHYIIQLRNNKCWNRHSSDTPLYEKISTSKEKYPKYMLIGFEKRKENHLKRSQRIIDCYQELKRTRHTAKCE